MKIITISGLDGSGKSTQVELLKNYLEAQDKKVFYFHIIDFSIANKLLGKKQKGNQNNKPKAITKAGKFSILLRKIALIIDLKRFSKLVKRMNNENKFDFLITDRYFYDQIVNILYLEKSTHQKKNYWTMKAEELITIPNYKMYIKLDPKIILERNSNLEQGAEYLKEKNNLFDKLAKKWNLIIIDGNNSIENIQNTIKNLINY